VKEKYWIFKYILFVEMKISKVINFSVDMFSQKVPQYIRMKLGLHIATHNHLHIHIQPFTCCVIHEIPLPQLSIIITKELYRIMECQGGLKERNVHLACIACNYTCALHVLIVSNTWQKVSISKSKKFKM
jgi:hypothetical protein